MTVKNENELLRNNILYHNFIGVSSFYIFNDNPDHKLEEVFKDLDYVKIFPVVAKKDFENIPECRLFINKYYEHLAARQSLNVMKALELAYNDGSSWLISIDADELICPDRESAERDNLKCFLKCKLIYLYTIPFLFLRQHQREDLNLLNLQ